MFLFLGLGLTLYIEQSEYTPALATSAGVRFAIHNQNEQPFPEELGFTASPGKKHNVEVYKV
jgi:hypothetical protein